jgi:hypothetical protein
VNSPLVPRARHRFHSRREAFAARTYRFSAYDAGPQSLPVHGPLQQSHHCEPQTTVQPPVPHKKHAPLGDNTHPRVAADADAGLASNIMAYPTIATLRVKLSIFFMCELPA